MRLMLLHSRLASHRRPLSRQLPLSELDATYSEPRETLIARSLRTRNLFKRSDLTWSRMQSRLSGGEDRED
jgi:hypothetical protein